MTGGRGLRALVGALAWTAIAAAAEPPGGAVDAELLRDLDVVASPSYTRDRELTRKMTVAERLRMLEALRRMETTAEPAGRAAGSTPAAPLAPKEVK